MNKELEQILMPVDQPRNNIGGKWCVTCEEQKVAFYCPSCQRRAEYPAHYCQHCGNYNGGM